jgi:hypothetical protein
MVSRGKPSPKTISEWVYDYMTKHKMATPLQLEQALGVDIKLIRDALNTLAREGRIIERYIASPRPPRVIPARASPLSPRIIPPRHVEITPPAMRKRPEQKSTQSAFTPRPPEIGTQTELPPTPLRTIRARIPADIVEETQRRTHRAKAGQSEARRKQKEIKKSSLVS